MGQITVLGMGAMGSRMATALLKAGHRVTVWNRSTDKTQALRAAGAKVADTPRAAVGEAEVVISMVRDDVASRHVWLDPEIGALSSLSAGAIAIESSTLTVAWVRELGQVCEQQGINFLDAPVAGSRPQADAGQLIYLVGGERDVCTQVEPILQVMGGAVHYVGPMGSGAVLKLAVNALLSVQVAAMAELLSFVQRCGLDGVKALDILASTPVCSPAAKAAAGSMLTHNFAPLFPVALVEKDLSYILATAQRTGTQIPLAQATHQVFAQALERGYGEDNITSVALLYP